MTFLVAGIDGGQSSTVAVVGDERGRILACGTSGPADEIGVAPESTRLRDALQDALADASRRAGLPQNACFEAIVAGVSGYDGRIRGLPPQLPSPRPVLLHDAPIAHAGALAGLPGVVVIAGTGSVVYTRDVKGSEHTFGGWGFLFGDEGSAFRIACDAIATLMRAEDDGDASFGPEMDAALKFFGEASMRQLAHAFYSGTVSRDRLASFAPAALRHERFHAIADRGADRLAALACRAIGAAEAARVALTGGLFGDDRFRRRICDGILAMHADAQVVEPRYEPAMGALLLAYRELGLDVRELHE